jgi:serine/threonine-protein kinase SRPK3
MTSNVHSLREKHHHRKKSIPNHLYILKNHAKSTHTVRKLIRSPYVASKRLIHEMNHLTLRVPHVKQVETLNYRPGGFHPVHLGDQFKKDRYRVIHKLGHGGFATVWLARDLVRNRYVALKILAARLSVTCPEVEILRRLRNAPDHIGKAYVMLDHFWITGPNGKHLCVVSQVGGPSIKEFNDCPGQTSGSRRLQAIVARKVALQATEGLAYIHSNGTVHGGIYSYTLMVTCLIKDRLHDRKYSSSTGEHRRMDRRRDLRAVRKPGNSGPPSSFTSILRIICSTLHDQCNQHESC